MKNTLADMSSKTVTIEMIKEELSNTEALIKGLISESLIEIKNNPSLENEILKCWTLCINDLDRFLFQETERTNTRSIYKNMIKNMFFRRF
jgi:hypothetical protein